MKEKFIDEVYPHQALVHKVCRMYRNSKQDQQDLFQEIMYQLWKSYPKYRGDAKITSWMYRIALNTAMAVFRNPGTIDLVTTEINHFGYEKGADIGNMETEVDTNEERLFSAIQKLNEADKALIALYLEDMSYAEIAEITGISESNVGVKLNRIKKRLKSILNI